MRSYLELLRDVIVRGEKRDDRTRTGTLSLFGRQWCHDMRKGFPLLTTKHVSLRQTFNELMWFLSGSTNANDLPVETQKWWSPWADECGDLGPIYGRQFRSARSWTDNTYGDDDEIEVKPIEVDQLAELLRKLEQESESRRLIMSTWNAADVPEMKLPCCHGLVIQFYVHNDGGLSLKMYQRSADIFIGVPVNIASYALLLMLVAKVTGYTPRELIITFGDLHLYDNHVDQAFTQLERAPRDLPSVEFTEDFPSEGSSLDRLLSVRWNHIRLTGYNPHPKISAPVAV